MPVRCRTLERTGPLGSRVEPSAAGVYAHPIPQRLGGLTLLLLRDSSPITGESVMRLQANLPVPALLFVLLLTSPMLMGSGTVKASEAADSPLEAWLWRYGHILLVAAVTLNARYAVYEVLHAALGARPSDGTLLGALLLTTVVGCVPLQAKNYTAWRSARRVTALLGILGVLLIGLQPPLPLQVGH